ncbi:MAG: 4Fe-4S ferredoxin, partial [Casimicrobiaceae bacterium]
MGTDSRQVFLCSCNGTIPLDADALVKHLGADQLPLHTALCQRELAHFTDGARGDVVVACTQEQRLFTAEAQNDVQSLRFVNIRESAGWSAQAKDAGPKIAALLEAAM